MGVDYNGARLLAYCKRAGVDFRSTVMIGRQTLDARPAELRAIFGLSRDLPRPGYAEPLFEALGAGTVDSIDVSDYEKATILLDMNRPIPRDLHGRFSFVLDGGALEHIFNFPVAIQNCMDMVAVGGHFVAAVPANNWTGHGFYQFSPELYYRVLSRENGFTVDSMFLATQLGRGKWLRVADPAVVRQRVTFANSVATSLYVVARKLEARAMAQTPQQSDYQMLSWQGAQQAPSGLSQVAAARAVRGVMRMLPDGLAGPLREVKERYAALRARLRPVAGLEKVAIESLPERRSHTAVTAASSLEAT